MLKNLPIITGNLHIDKFTPDDVDDLFVLMSHAAIMQFIPDRYRTKEELQQTLKWLISNYSMAPKKITRLSFGIRLKETKELIGWITYGPLPYDESLKEIAYASDPAYWNHGFATAAGKALLQWLSKNITDCDIYAQVNPENHRSIRVLEKLGMVKVKADALIKDRKPKEVWLYKIQRKTQNHSS